MAKKTISDKDYRFSLNSEGAMKMNEIDWAENRLFLTHWLKQMNEALFRTRKQIGKAIQLQILGSLDKEKVLENSNPKPQDLEIRVLELDEQEVKDKIMKAIKGFSIIDKNKT